MVKKLGLVFLAVLVMAAGAYGAGLALSGVSSKAIGMGGAFRGLADNWSAAYWNPAGLAQLSTSEFNLMAIAITPRPEFAPNITFNDYEVGYKNGEARFPNDETSFAPNLSGFFKLPSRPDLTFGVALFVPYALGSEWDLFDPIYEDAFAAYPKWDHKGVLRVIDIHPSLAKSFFDDRLMLGAGLSIMRGSIDYRKAFLQATPLPRPHDNVAMDVLLKGEGWGYGANAGIIYKISDKLQVGISGKTPTTIKLEGDVDMELYTINNIDLMNQALASASTYEESLSIDFIFSEVANQKWQRDATADLKLPADIGIGFAYALSEKTMLTLDIAYTFWSRLDSIVVDVDGSQSPIDPTPAEDIVVRTKWDDLLRFSIGGEHYLSDPFSLRFGFYYDPSPIPDETLTPLIPDMGAKYSGNIGAAYRVSGWELGYNFEYINFSSRDVAPDSNSGTDFDNYPGSYKAFLIANHLSLTYRF